MAIDLRFRIQKVGHYNVYIDQCNKCWENLFDFRNSSMYYNKHVINNVIGFFEYNGRWYTTVECPHCFTKFYFHLREGSEDPWYELFLESVERGTNLHFKPIPQNVAEHE